MPVLAIVGAGAGMGLAIAKTFGANGYKVGLLSRNSAKPQPLVAELAEHSRVPA
jgi:NADP-dependent 3-hydroxy acid dehydrogenase YdfG